jgi:hypothetical protein
MIFYYKYEACTPALVCFCLRLFLQVTMDRIVMQLAFHLGLPTQVPNENKRLLITALRTLGFQCTEDNESLMFPFLAGFMRDIDLPYLANLWKNTPGCDCNFYRCIKRTTSLEPAIMALVLGLPMNCEIVEALTELQQFGELEPHAVHTYLKNRILMQADADNFCCDDRVPTPFKGDLPIVQCQEGMICGLCLEGPKTGENVFSMPCCKTVFHYDRCVGGYNILKWFEEKKNCPGCNQVLDNKRLRQDEKAENPAKRARRA